MLEEIESNRGIVGTSTFNQTGDFPFPTLIKSLPSSYNMGEQEYYAQAQETETGAELDSLSAYIEEGINTDPQKLSEMEELFASLEREIGSEEMGSEGKGGIPSVSLLSSNVIQEQLDFFFKLFKLAKDLGNISKACREMGTSKKTFCKYKKLYEQGGEPALRYALSEKFYVNKRRRVSKKTEDSVVAYSKAHPADGQRRVARAIREMGMKISPSGVRGIWQRRHDDLGIFDNSLHSTGGPRSKKKRTAKETEDSVVAFSIAHPRFGRRRVADAMKKMKIPIAATTIQSIWRNHDLEKPGKRWRKALEKNSSGSFDFIEDQLST